MVSTVDIKFCFFNDYYLIIIKIHTDDQSCGNLIIGTVVKRVLFESSTHLVQKDARHLKSTGNVKKRAVALNRKPFVGNASPRDYRDGVPTPK